MKLLKITPKNSMHFRMSDGRLGVVYTSGYVRVSTKSRNKKLYQINKLTKVLTPTKWNADNYNYKRELINNSEDRIKMLFKFNQANCI